MNLVIELLNREKEFIANLKSCNNADEQELQMLAEIDQALQLIQSCVVGRSEQLKAFDEWFNENWYPEGYSHLAIEAYLKSL